MERLKILRKKRGLLQKDMAAYLEIDRTTYSKYETGDSEPDNVTLDKIAKYFNVSIDYLLGRTDIEDPYPSTHNAKGIRINRSKGVRIPVVGMSAAGIPIEAVQMYIDDDDPDTWEEITENQARNGTHVAIKIRGDSMEPKISDGDIVIVRLQPTVESGEIAIVIVNGDEATCKKVKIQQDGLILISTNPAYEPMFYSAADVERLPVRIFGKVVEARRKF